MAKTKMTRRSAIAEITHRYAVQEYPKTMILVPIESPHATFY